jgi:N-acyl-D-aspartate/D-glutamate deacylase
MTVDWESFGDFLDGLEGATALNAGFLVGHCALRRYVMGPAAMEREARPGELDALRDVLHQSLAAGGLGLSTTRSPTHPDHQGNPVASRLAGEDEVLALCDVVGQHPGTTLEAIVAGCLNGFDPAEIELLAQMSARADRPLNWNVLTVAAADRAGAQHQLAPGARAREIGGRVVALTMPTFADNNMSFGTYCALWLIPGWREVLSLPEAEKTARLRDPAVRAALVAGAQGTVFQRFANFGRYRIGDTVAEQNRRYEGRVVADIARENGVDAGECLIEILVADRFATVLWPLPAADSDADWSLRRDLWAHPDVLLGGSDAGAHLDRMLGSSYPTRFLADTLRGRRLLSVEQAVHLMTDAPARLFGLRDRGQLSPGAFGDVVLVDPETVDSGPATRVHDLPGRSLRLTAASCGIEKVFVNGVVTIEAGEPTGATAGRVLRSGRDTDTVTTHKRGGRP